MQLDQGNHSAAELIARLKDYFKTEQVLHVKADVWLVILVQEEPDVEALADQCVQLAIGSSSSSSSSSSAAASTTGKCATAGRLKELIRFPAHSFILDGTAYFSQQQVRDVLLRCAACLVLLCDTVASAAAHQ
jgi:hypothetical protein